MSGYDRGETCDAYSERIIGAARKEHRCSACQASIRKGDRYSYTSIVFEGSVEAIKRCLRCEYIYRSLKNDYAAGRITDLDTEYIAPRLDCGHRYEDTHAEPIPDHLARVAFMTVDEIQALDFSELDRESKILRLESELRYSRKTEMWFRTAERFRPADFEWARRCNDTTCRLELTLEALRG